MRNTKMSDELQILDTISRQHFNFKNGIYDLQKDLYWRIEENEFNIILKSRQIGASFFYAGYNLLKGMRGDKNLIISPSLRQSGRVGHYMDSWLGGFQSLFSNVNDMILEHNKSMIRFDNGGFVETLPNSPSSIRGSPADRIFFDEYAHFLHGTDAQVWEALLPSLSRGARKSVVINSTPFGESNLFYEMYKNREEYPDFIPVFYHYSECPDINIEKIRRNMDSLSFSQEYEGAFIGDLNTFYPYSLTKECINSELEYVQDLASLGIPLYGAADIGRRRDFTAITILAYIQGKLRVVFKKVLRTQKEKEWDNQYALFRILLKTPNMARFYIDAGFGVQLVETMQKEFGSLAIPITFTNDNKHDMHSRFKKRIETKGIEYPHDMEIVNCLHLIQRIQAGNKVRYDSDKRTDEHGHADVAVSLVLANYCFEKESQNIVQPMAHISKGMRRRKITIRKL